MAGMEGMGGYGRRGAGVLQAMQFEQAHREQNLDSDDLRQALKDQAARADAIHAQQAAIVDPGNPEYRGVLHPDGSTWAPNGGPMLRDQNGTWLQTPSVLANQAQGALASKGIDPTRGDAGTAQQMRAMQGFNPGEKMPIQIKAQMMQGLAQAITQLPPEDRQIAYERAVGVMAGKGTVNIHDMPEWTAGGEAYMKQVADQKNLADQQLETIKTQGALGAAYIKAHGDVQVAQAKNGTLGGALNGAPIPLEDQLKGIMNDPTKTPLEKKQAMDGLKDMGLTDGPGEPVGAPISARSMKSFTAANTAMQHIDAMSTLLTTNPNLSILGAKFGTSLGGLANAALSPTQQSFNTLATHLNDFVNNVSGEPSLEKGQIDRLSKSLPTTGDSAATILQKLQLLKDESKNVIASVDPSGHIARVLSLQAQQQQAQAAQQQPVQPVNTAPPPIAPGLSPQASAQAGGYVIPQNLPSYADVLHAYPGVTPPQYQAVVQQISRAPSGPPQAQVAPQAQAAPMPQYPIAPQAQPAYVPQQQAQVAPQAQAAPGPLLQAAPVPALRPGDKLDYNPQGQPLLASDHTDYN